MTQEDKELLLKDLCARLPYRTMVKCNTDYHHEFDEELSVIHIMNFYQFDVKPYLRPMSSMTEEEDKEYTEVIVKSQDCSLENSESATTMANDWLLSKRFDVRGLISKGLAIEAPEGMYK